MRDQLWAAYKVEITASKYVVCIDGGKTLHQRLCPFRFWLYVSGQPGGLKSVYYICSINVVYFLAAGKDRQYAPLL